MKPRIMIEMQTATTIPCCSEMQLMHHTVVFPLGRVVVGGAAAVAKQRVIKERKRTNNRIIIPFPPSNVLSLVGNIGPK